MIKLYKHQRQALNKANLKKGFLYLMEQGTGKTITALVEAWELYDLDLIDCVVILAPNGVHRQWIESELNEHFGDKNYETFVWRGVRSEREQNKLEKIKNTDSKLTFFSFNYEAVRLNINRGTKSLSLVKLEEIVNDKRCLLIADESTRIGNPDAQQTLAALLLSKKCEYKRGLSGTCINGTPLTLYSQLKLIDSTILTYNYAVFKSIFAVTKDMVSANKKVIRIIVGFKNLLKLAGILEPHSYRVKAEDCLDLPKLSIVKIKTELSPKQSKLYNELRDKLVSEFENEEITAPHVLTLMIRLQQISNGFVKVDFSEECQLIDAENNKVAQLLNILKSIDDNRKIIIWSRSVDFLKHIYNILESEFPNQTVRYWGGISKAEREDAKEKFLLKNREDLSKRIFLGNPAAGGTGLNLQAANYMIYLDRYFDLEINQQSEKRHHRNGQNLPCFTYYISNKDTIDEKIEMAIERKENIKSIILKDKLKYV